MTAPTTPPNTPMGSFDVKWEQPRPNPIKKGKAFTFDVDLPTVDKRHEKLSEEQLKIIRERFLNKDDRGNK